MEAVYNKFEIPKVFDRRVLPIRVRSRANQIFNLVSIF